MEDNNILNITIMKKIRTAFVSQSPMNDVFDMYIVWGEDEERRYYTANSDGFRTAHMFPPGEQGVPLIRTLSRNELQSIANALRDVNILAEGEVPAKNELELVKQERDHLMRQNNELIRALYTQLPGAVDHIGVILDGRQ